MRGVKTAEREGAMFHKNRTRKKDSKPKEAGYKLTYDNLAIPEVHTHEQPEIMDSTEDPGDVTYDSVAIPEVHIRKKGTKPTDQ